MMTTIVNGIMHMSALTSIAISVGLYIATLIFAAVCSELYNKDIATNSFVRSIYYNWDLDFAPFHILLGFACFFWFITLPIVLLAFFGFIALILARFIAKKIVKLAMGAFADESIRN